jgi:hypothetical protein
MAQRAVNSQSEGGGSTWQRCRSDFDEAAGPVAIFLSRTPQMSSCSSRPGAFDRQKETRYARRLCSRNLGTSGALSVHGAG